jgi:hypothetical protein
VPLQVRPLNQKERDEGARNCVQFDDGSKQVVLSVSPSFHHSPVTPQCLPATN